MKKLLIFLFLCLLVGSVSGYTNYVTYSYNITAPMGTQTEYPVMFIFSNATGISGHYSEENVIFTNGTTRPDWFDINASDGAGTYYSFWVENNTYTSNNATVWLKVPTIAVGNTSTGRWDYGYAAQSSSTANIVSMSAGTGDDFSGTSLTANWTNTANTAVSAGILTVGSGGTGNPYTVATYGVNYSVRSRTSWQSAASGTEVVGFMNTAINSGTIWNGISAGVNQLKPTNYNGGSITAGTDVGTGKGYHIYTASRNGSTNAIYSEDDGTKQIISTNLYTTAAPVLFYGGATSQVLIDWIFVRKFVGIEPTTSAYTTYTAGIPLTSNFTANTTVGYQSPWAVAFTDTTTGSPTTFNWTYGDGYTSTSQNPTHIYTVANNYTVSLNTTNSTGFSLVTKYIELRTDDDIWLKSWNQFDNATVIDLKGTAWTANNAATSTTQKKWGTRSLDVTLNDAYLTASSSALWDWGSQNAVMEFWIYPTTIVANKNLIARSTGTGTGNVTGWALRSNSSGTGYYWRMGANTTSSFTLPLNTWTLIKIERDGAYVEIYKNGVIESDTFMPGIYDTANPIYIGQVSGGADNTFYLDEFRFTNGISREVGAYSPNYAAYNGNLYTNWININTNATFRYKTNPGDLVIIYNQTAGGMRNRTVQIQNMTNATYISGKMDFRPNVMMAQRVNLNKSTYTDLVLTSSSIDPVNGIVNFNVSRSAGVSALFDNRTNLLDVEMLYWNYTTETQIPMYFAQGDLIDGQHNAAYPIMNFIATNVTIGDWGTPLTTPTADNVTPQSYQTVQFLGNSTNYPNAWNWSFGDGTYSSLQSPTHQYTSNGLKTVSLTGYQSLNATITNTTTLTNYINVSGNALSGFTRQDLVMSPQFTLQVTFVDSSTNLPIPVVTVTDSIGGNQTTSTGVFTGTYEYSTVVLYAFSSGYDAKAASYVMDGDRVEIVQLTKTTQSPSQTTFWSPHNVEFQVIDANKQTVIDTYVSITAIQSTLPGGYSGCIESLKASYGIPQAQAEQMLSSATMMNGTTDATGGLTFLMLPTLGYTINVDHGNFTTTVYPKNTQYTIQTTSSLYTQPQNVISNYNSASYDTLNMTEPNVSYITMQLFYYDANANTNYIQFWVKNMDNNTVVYRQNTNIPNLKGPVLSNYTVPNIRGEQWKWGYDATHP